MTRVIAETSDTILLETELTAIRFAIALSLIAAYNLSQRHTEKFAD
jgi:hypothetical protein